MPEYHSPWSPSWYQLRFKLDHPRAKLPTRGYELDAGLDLYALGNDDGTPIILEPVRSTHEEDAIVQDANGGLETITILRPNDTPTKIRTGVCVEIPPGYVGKIMDRSSMGMKGTIIPAGVIDSEYRGEIVVLMHNLTSKPIEIHPTDKIAQLVIIPIALFDPVEVKELSPSRRGEKGFGSTGR